MITIEDLAIIDEQYTILDDGWMPRTIDGVDDPMILDEIRELVKVWRDKVPGNLLRTLYYNGSVGIRESSTIPYQAMRNISAVLDWPEKAVSSLAERSVFEGFVTPGGDEDPYDLGILLDANRFDLELPQAITSAYKHSCSFFTVTGGDVGAGEPPVLIQARSAEWSAGRWDSRRRVMRSAMTITEIDTNRRPIAFEVFLPGAVVSCVRKPSGRWAGEVKPIWLQEVLVEPLPFDPQLDRPFGRARISKAVMSITDHALSTIVRAEVGADFYTLPKVIITRVAEETLAGGESTKWKMTADRITLLTKDEDDSDPKVNQLQQMTMNPLLEQFKLYATQFSGATGVPVSSLGIITENPPSAESIYAADRQLTMTARKQNRVMTAVLRRVAAMAIKLRDGVDNVGILSDLDVSWAKPEFTSPGTAADALIKLSSVFPWIGESDVALEMAGFTSSEITRLNADRRRVQDAQRLDALIEIAKKQEVMTVSSSIEDGEPVDDTNDPGLGPVGDAGLS